MVFGKLVMFKPVKGRVNSIFSVCFRLQWGTTFARFNQFQISYVGDEQMAVLIVAQITKNQTAQNLHMKHKQLYDNVLHEIFVGKLYQLLTKFENNHQSNFIA